jgi:dCMP deaminase
VAHGWNGFPRGVDDDVDERHERPAKYLWTEHAERNAIYNAAAIGAATAGCTMYLPWYPCTGCARAIIQSGISEVVCVEPDWGDSTYATEFAVTKEMFNDTLSGKYPVKVRFLKGYAPPQFDTR